ncbi:Lipase precursor [Arthrobacter saudimassiliensis]|uniref:Lipase n=1 Tax=Arthrobacter saudimassiliensis TaxID=1461584 RepID=A0A078MU93_9MICC|nr:Lipase precursor [Arthrobacter saudimassiliensis]
MAPGFLRRPRLAAAVVLLALLAGPAPAGAAPERGGRGDDGGHHPRGRTVDYVALGDSYASGYGGSDVVAECGRTAFGYPALLDALHRVDLQADATCAGATALATDPAPPAGPVDLPQQIDTVLARGQLHRGTDLVTVTIGGNDVRFGDVVAACAGPGLPATCAPAITGAREYARTVLAPGLAASLQRLRDAAPQAELVVTGYPHLFEAAVPGALSVPAQELFNAGTDELNAVISAQLPGDAVFVDVVDEFAGHGIGSPDPWIRLEGGPFDLHPNAAGYEQGYLPAILADASFDDRRGRHGCR